MFQRSRTVPLYAVALSVILLAAFAAPAAAHHRKGGKTPFGEISAFDGVTLTVSMGNGGTLVAPVADDVKIKVEHRGHKENGKQKKPSNGTLDDLDVGAKVLKIKVFCGEVSKLRLRRPPGGDTEVLGSVLAATDDALAGDDTGGETTEVEVPDDEESDDANDDDPCTDDGDSADDSESGTGGDSGSDGSGDGDSDDSGSDGGTDGDGDDDGILDDLLPVF